jgi:hypothetical protein
MRKGKLFVDRANVDDFSAGSGLAAVIDERLRDEERTLEIDVEDEIVVGFGDIPEIGAAFEACIVDEDVDATERGDGVGDELLPLSTLPTSAWNAAALRSSFCTSATTSSAPVLLER